MVIFVLFQWHCLSHHTAAKHEYNEGDVRRFAEHFSLLGVSRTFAHEKGIDYWFDWIAHSANLIAFNKTLTVLHFDAHGVEDDSAEPFHVCSPHNLLAYDFFVEHVLEAAHSAYFADWRRYGNGSVSRHALRKGYAMNIAWVYPEHWSDSSQLDAFRAMIRHQTYFLNPSLDHFLYLESATTSNPLWDALFKGSSRRDLFRAVEHRPDAAQNLEINIWTLSLTECLSESSSFSNLIVDIDLDFFQCQEPAMAFMAHHGWNEQLMSRFNGVLSHHQYTPSHLLSEHRDEAILTLLHLLNAKGAVPVARSLNGEGSEFAVPRIAGVLAVAIEEEMDIETIRRAMHLLSEYQLERSRYDSSAAEHPLYFEHILEILERAQRRLAELDTVETVESREAVEAPLRFKRASAAKHQLLEDAQRRYKEEQLRTQRMEIQSLREINNDRDAVHRELDEFAASLMERVGPIQRRRLHSAAIDAEGRQRASAEEEAASPPQHRVLEGEWTDGQLKDLLNMTANYLFSDWPRLLFGDDAEGEEGALWRAKYPQWLSHRVHSELSDDGLPRSEEAVDAAMQRHSESWAQRRTAPYNQDNDHLEQFGETEEGAGKERQSRFRLRWQALDPLQRHFLERADHSELQSLVDGLGPKQSRLLEWLLFCCFHRVKCRGARYLPETFNKSKHFGHDFAWHELNGWPRLSAAEESGALQLEIGRRHLPFAEAEPHDISFKPTEEGLQRTLSRFVRLLEADHVEPLLLGIELSPGHIPRDDRLRLECSLYSAIEGTLFHRRRKPGFLRLRRLMDDPVLPYRPCSAHF